ncbi:hypothetical protein P389DRAFT_175778 [Cystobasidium minutum MCA 4210]|uniref:uncharacterized protein n=1 Tax=Cystobasidium minutum MCA 4210 TaxID=1397322 RepID=UPI0034CE1C72|eukprot:jgi/Rhomi1/175778/fgenesh1_kg.12_\
MSYGQMVHKHWLKFLLVSPLILISCPLRVHPFHRICSQSKFKKQSTLLPILASHCDITSVANSVAGVNRSKIAESTTFPFQSTTA